jgi:hypothetical protein
VDPPCLAARLDLGEGGPGSAAGTIGDTVGYSIGDACPHGSDRPDMTPAVDPVGDLAERVECLLVVDDRLAFVTVLAGDDPCQGTAEP